MTLMQAQTQALRHYIKSRRGKIFYNWIELVEIRRKIGSTKRQVDKIIDDMKETGEVVLQVFNGNVVIRLVNKNKKTLAEGNPQASEEKGN